MASAAAKKSPENNVLEALLAKAKDHCAVGMNYAGDVEPKDAYQILSALGGVLVDVRTPPEWQFTGTADVSGTQGALLTISWKTYPGFALNPDFAKTLVSESAITKDTPLFFMCRSGGRSLDAAVAMTAQGYRYCFNVSGGFEGEPDEQGHRGRKEGWKAASLPWKQG